MTKEEILVGLNNGITRGASLEEAMQTLIMAGYNTAEVQEVAKEINMGVISSLPSTQQKKAPQQNTEYKPLSTAQNQDKPKKKFSWTLVIILSLFFLALLGTAAYLYFGTNIFKS